MSTLPSYDQLADLLSEARGLLSSHEHPPHPSMASHVLGFLDRVDDALTPIAELPPIPVQPVQPVQPVMRVWHIEGSVYWSAGFEATISATTVDAARQIAASDAIDSAGLENASFDEFVVEVCYEVKDHA